MKTNIIYKVCSDTFLKVVLIFDIHLSPVHVPPSFPHYEVSRLQSEILQNSPFPSFVLCYVV